MSLPDEHRAMSNGSSTEDDDWHSTPASPSMTMTTATEPDVDTDAESDAHARKSQDAATPTAEYTASMAAIPHARKTESVGSGEQNQSPRDGQDQRGMADAQRGARPGSDSDNAQGPGSDVTSQADNASDSARDRSPSPSIAAPPPARRQSQHYYFTSPHTRVGSISSVHSASSSHNPNATFQFPPATPGRRNGRHVRPISMASVMSAAGQGPASPASPRSPRTSGYYHQYHQSYSGGSASNAAYNNILNRPLPQTPTASVSGSRPASLQFFASPTAGLPAASSSSAHWEPQVAANLRQQHSVPRPLRLQPSLMRRDTVSSTTTADVPMSPVQAAAAAAASSREETVLLRAHQAASRMSRRRQWEQRLSPNEYSLQRSRLESNEGAFEVVNCFLQRLARAENDSLLIENFPRSSAQQLQQKEDMATMRKETVEALLPLLAYGPSDPTPVKPVPKPTSFAPAASKTGPAPPSKAYAPRNVSGNSKDHHSTTGMPPTPPLSPYRHDPRRESGMSGITETSLNGGADEGNTTVWSSVKRASMMFGWGANNSGMPSPAQSTRFTGE